MVIGGSLLRRKTSQQSRARTGRMVLGAGALLVGCVATGVATEAVAGAAAGDGTTVATSGASCWGIKQQYPASATGLYYLQTPKLVEPKQYYCDMTTDGGAWVLVGRGMQGWTWSPAGQRVTSVTSTPTGL